MKSLQSSVVLTVSQPSKASHHAQARPGQISNRSGMRCWAMWVAVLVCLATGAKAASVGPSGYTNSFSARPSAADFSTSGGIAGGSGDIGSPDALDAFVQNVAASTISAQVTDSSPANPPAKLAAAQWTSGGSAYLVTRPTGNRATVLMATLANNTGTNCNVLHFNYQLTVGASFTEEVPGQRLFYSFSSVSNAWTLIPAVSGLNASQLVSADVPLNQMWNNGGTLYLLWVDDNAADSTESAYEIDNFFASAYSANIPLTLALATPANGQHFGFGSTISASVTLTGSPTNVSYYLDGALAVIRTAIPFTPVTLPAQTLGSHTVYATAQDTNNTLVTTVTNTFVVDLSLSGTLSTNTTLYASNSPYVVTGNLTVPNGVTLTIEPGTTVQFASGISLTVASGGRLLAEGNANSRILFTRSGASGYWGNIIINGAVGSPETRIAYADFEFNANSTGTACLQVSVGAVFLDHLVFHNTGAPYLHLDGGSFIVQDCVFPSATALFELVHGTSGIRSDGHGLFLRNFFGVANSISGNYNDVLDFTGGNRPGPIIQFFNNVFIGSGDDHLDLDSTDAWIEGNIFLHAHRNGSPDSSSGVSGGADNADTSQITIIGNIFYDCDQAAMAKQGNFYTLFNNTIVHQTHQGGVDTDGAVICMDDPGFAEGAGMYLEGNIVYDAEKLVRAQTTSIVTYTNNILCNVQSGTWTGPGGGNSTNNPMFKYVPALSETTNFTSWAQAQIMWDWFSLLPASPGIGTGPNGIDKGAVVPYGATVSGEPAGTTSTSNATLVVGLNRTGNGIPTTSAAWPNGSGFTHYKWRLDTNAWSAETPITLPVTLSNLVEGPHFVEVVGKNDAGLYQNDPELGPDAAVTRSRTWTVQTGPVAPYIQSIVSTEGAVLFSFEARVGQSYSVLTSDSLEPGSWQNVENIGPLPDTTLITVTNTLIDPKRFYRLVTPAQ